MGATDEPPVWGSPPEPAYLPPGAGTAPPPVSPSPFAVVAGVRRSGRRAVGAALYGLGGLTGGFLLVGGLARAVLALTGHPLDVDDSTSRTEAAFALVGGLVGLGTGVLFGARRANPAQAVPRSAHRRLVTGLAAPVLAFVACLPVALVDEAAYVTVYLVVAPLATAWFVRPYRRRPEPVAPQHFTVPQPPG